MLNLTGTSKTYPGVVHEMQDIHLDVPRGMFGLLEPPRFVCSLTLSPEGMQPAAPELEDVYFSTLIAHNLKDNLE